MSSNFDWRAEDDISWEEYAAGDPAGGSGPEKKRSIWLIGGVVLLVLFAVGYLAFRQVRRYVENTAESVEEDVLSSHALVKMAAEEGDLELFAPLLSGRDPNWTQDQLTLMDSNLLFDRRPFGLIWQPKETADDISVRLSNDLQSAEVSYVETYGYGLEGEEEGIQLTQTAVYRLSETRWLLSPPDDNFWGDWISSKGRFVTLTYPERDEEIGRRLAADLEATLAGACSKLELGCSGEGQVVDVLLTTDPEAMVEADNPDYFANEAEQLILPAPTLVGKPTSSSSYRAFFRGYATFLVARLIARQADWQCCDQSPFFKALVDVQLQQLSLQPWPLVADNYRQTLHVPVDLGTIRSIRNNELSIAELRERPEWVDLYLFIEFLASHENIPPIIELQRTMARTASLNAWLVQAEFEGNLNLIVEDWRNFIRQRIVQTQSSPSTKWPQEDIALLCNDGQIGSANVYRYDPDSYRWSLSLADRNFVVMDGLPGNTGLILTEQYLDIDHLRTTIWRDNQEVVVNFGEEFVYSEGVSDPAGRFLILNRAPNNNNEDFSFNLFELENCSNDACNFTRLPGEPVWSPDGNRAIWVNLNETESIGNDNETYTIYIGDDRLQDGVMVSSGLEPFWLDNETFAYLSEISDPALMVGKVDGEMPGILLEAEDLEPVIAGIESEDIKIIRAFSDRLAPGTLFLIVANRSGYENYFISYELQSGELKMLFTAEDAFGGLKLNNISPDGRWISFITLNTNPNANQSRSQYVYLFNIESETLITYNLVDNTTLGSDSWTNNSQWLVFLDNGYIMLSNPDTGFDYLVPFDFRDCTDISWVM